MAYAKFLSCLLVLSLTSIVQSKMCNLDDEECLTKGASKFYKILVAGAGNIEPLEPIRVDKVEGESPGVKYIITNGTMSQLKDCEVTKLKLNKQDLSFEYNLLCPQLVLNFRYDVKGVLFSLPVDGIAEEKVTIDDYFVIFKGKYALFVSEKDKKPRGTIKSFIIETDPRGKFTFENINVIRGDKQKVDKANEFANKNWRAMEKMMKSPLLEAFMQTMVDKVNMHLNEIPLEDAISQE